LNGKVLVELVVGFYFCYLRKKRKGFKGGQLVVDAVDIGW